MRSLFLVAALLAGCGTADAKPSPPAPSPAQLHLPSRALIDVVSTAGTPLSQSLSTAQPGAGFVEIVLTPTGTLPDGQLAWSDPASDPGSITILSSNGAGNVQAVMSGLAVGTDSTQGARLDTTKFWVYSPTPRRVQVMWTWSANAAGVVTMSVVQNGVIDRPSQVSDFGFGTFARPAVISTWQVGKKYDLSTFQHASINRVSIGRARISGELARAMARSAGTTPKLVVIGAGDSNTDSQVTSNGWTATLNTSLGVGPGRAVVGNHGVSGDTVGQLLARVEAIADNEPDVVCVAVGTNNIFRDGNSWAAVQQTYVDLYARLRAGGARIVGVSIPPMRADSTWGWYTSGKEAQRLLGNMWIAAHADVYVDLDGVLLDPNGHDLLASLTTDGVHFNSAGHAVVGARIWVQGFASVVYP